MSYGTEQPPSGGWPTSGTGTTATAWPSAPPASPPTAGWPASPPTWGGPPPMPGPAAPPPSPGPVRRTGGWGAIAATFVVTAVVVALLVTALTGGGRLLGGTSTTAAPTRPVPTQPSTGSGSSSGSSSGSGGVQPGSRTTPSTTEPSTSSGAGPSSWAEVASLVNPGVVNIESRLPTGIGAGTGMVLSEDGEILTNNHVVEDATAIEVTLVSTGDVYRATVVGTDPSEDVAVLHLEDASGLTTIPLGDSDTVEVGDEVAAIGNAGGKGGDPTVASGKVVGLGRTITASDETGQNVETLHGLIQVDANVQPGDSGGPLADATGKVVGIDTAAATSSGGRGRTRSGGTTTVHEGYAIPINHALEVAEQLKAGTDPNGRSGSTGSSSTTGRALLGVQVRAGTDGADVVGVQKSSGAADAGIVAGDTIVAVDGTEVTGPRDLLEVLSAHQPGEEVAVEWLTADGEQQQATVTLGEG